MSLRVPFTNDLKDLKRNEQMLEDVIANANYFDGRWAQEFAADLTGKQWHELSKRQQEKVIELWTEQM